MKKLLFLIVPAFVIFGCKDDERTTDEITAIEVTLYDHDDKKAEGVMVYMFTGTVPTVETDEAEARKKEKSDKEGKALFELPHTLDGTTVWFEIFRYEMEVKLLDAVAAATPRRGETVRLDIHIP